MKRKFTLLIAALALLTMIVQPGRAWGQAPVNTVLWSETWTGGTYDENPSDYGFEGTTVYNNATLTYSQNNPNTRVYNATLAGGTTPELLLQSGDSWTITNIPTGAATELTLTYKSNNTKSSVTCSTEGTTITGSSKSYTIEPGDNSAITLVFGCSGNTRIDDITLIVKTAGGGTPTVATPTFNPAEGTYYETQNVSILCSTDDATIYYTTNGDDPTTSSNIYSAPLSINTTTTIKALATKSGMDNSAIASATYTISESVEGYDIDFEDDASAYTNWTFSNMTSKQNKDITAHGGDYFGTTGGKGTASVTTANKVNTPGTLTCYVSKASNNTTTSTWYIQVSTDGSNWTEVISRSATDMSKGEWVDFEADLSNYSNVYVRVYYSGSTAVRTIDDLTLTTATPATVATPTFNPASGTEFGNEGLEVTISQADNKPIYYTLDGTDPTSSSTPYAAPFQITTTTTVKAIAYDGENASNVASATYTYVDPDAPGTQNNPYTVAQAIANTPSGGNVYIQGIVSAFYNTSIIGDGNNFRYYISDDGTTTGQLLVYKGKGLNEATFTNVDDLLVGDEVVIYGELNIYNNAPQIKAGNYLYSWNRPAAPVATPTFNPEAGVYTEAQNVEISCETEGSTIYYTTDGTEPTNASTEYTGAISVTETTTIKAIAIKNSDASTVATANYYICSQENPYTVTEALAFAEYQYPANGIYVHGIVSTAPTQAPTNNGELTYYISVDGEAENELEVYKGKGLEQAAFTAQDDIQVGDIVTIYGNVQVYNTVIEFGSGNYLVSFERPTPPVEPSITVNPATVNATAAETEGTIIVTYENITTVVAEVYFCDAQGAATTYEWVDAEIDDDYNVYYTIDANTGEARTAYLKVHAFDDDANDVYSDLVTINQAAPVTPPTTDNYELFSGALVEGDYIIYYEGSAMKNTVSNNRLSYETVTPENDVIITDDVTIVWHIAQSGDYWTIYSDEAEAYAASTGTKNQAQMLSDGTDDKALWTVSGTETYEFVNKANAAANINAYLRNNVTSTDNYGFACYAQGTGGDLSLYKKVDNSPSISADNVNIAYDATSGSIMYEISNYIAGTMAATTEAEWISTFTYEQVDEIGTVSFTTTANQSYESRSATVTLTYTYNDSKATATKDVTVTQAAAPAPTFIVIFELDGGTFVPNDDFTSDIVEIEAGTYTLPSATKTGFTFAGWDDGTDTYAAGAEYTVSADVNFTATYTELSSYTVSFSVNGTIDDNLTATGSSIVLPTTSALTPTGFEIVGWALENSTEAVANPYEPTANVTLYALLQLENTQTTYNYVKVTEALEDWTGEYLIVYESTNGNLAFDGSRENFDAVGNSISVTISNNKIAANAATDASKFTIATFNNGYSIMGASGKYIGNGSNSNGLTTSDDALKNTISYDNNSNSIFIVSSGGAYLRYNKNSDQTRFRYFKSSSYTNQQAIQLYKKTTASPDTYNTIVNVNTSTTITDNIAETELVVVASGAVLTFNGQNNGSAANLIIEDGGQVIVSNSGVQATFKKSVSHSAAKDANNWYTISSPVNNITPSAVTNLIQTPADNYDLYYYDEENVMWKNHKKTAITNLTNGKGYLYWNAGGDELSFPGELNSGNIEIALTKTGTGDLAGWNLIGNPYSHNIYKGAGTAIVNSVSEGYELTTGFYTLANSGAWVPGTDNTTAIVPGQGILVKATTAGTLTMTNTNSSGTAKANNDNIQFLVSNSEYEDITYALFNTGIGLDKINHRNADIPMVYIPQNGQNYAIATMDDNTQAFELNFKAMTTGQYTLSYKAEGKYSYLHVIDRLTGEDIDMLLDGEYSFIGSPRDNEARFIVKLSYNANIDEIEVNDNFAYQNGSDIIVNGNGELQVFDVTGRMVMNTKINGIQTVNVPATGMYIFRMVGESVQTQKIVVR